MSKEYWIESLESSFDEHGVKLTREQIEAIADDMAISHEHYGLAYPTPENPLRSEVSDLKRELAKEKSKVVCKHCSGEGRVTSVGPYHSSNSECYKCRGRGFLYE